MTSRPRARSHGCDGARRRAVYVNGLTLRALEWGEPGRPALCFLHGGSAHAHWFDAVAPAFTGRYHVISLDQRGHGESDWPQPQESTSYATEAFAADLVAVMDALGWERTVLVGHSMGGHNAMAFAGWHPERVSALGIVDSRPSIPAERLASMHRRGHRGPRRHEALETAVRSFRLLPPETTAEPALLEHLAREGIVERQGRFLYRFDPACNGTRRPTDCWPLLNRVSAPTLIVRGEHSPILTREMAAEMARRIPRVRVEEIPGAYHHLVLDAPDAFTRVLDDFLREVTPPSP
ncbi:MAG TPA: alpha/beta hydrolase [Methylomirabilota bacterium]|nr:alpha/beta hydrolase [Methylomirabilota bacterium]